MKFMKLGTRPDTFYTVEAARSVSSEISTDLTIEVQNSRYLLHKFPLFSKCLLLQRLCSRSTDSADQVIQLPDFPGDAEVFEVCAKFCYGITITLSALNIVPVRCAAEYLQMTDELDKGNFIGKLDVFLNSCILRRWRDSLVTLQSTRQFFLWSEDLQITSRCIDALSSVILNNPTKFNWSHRSEKPICKDWWADDISELGIDLYWRIMVAVKSAGMISDKLIGEALKVYACRWLPNMSRDGKHGKKVTENSCAESTPEITQKHRLLLEKIVTLLPIEKGSLSCSFLLRLLKAANILKASPSSKMDLARRVGIQLEEATVTDLLIPSLSCANDTLYDVDIVLTMLEEFMLQGMSPPTSPPRGKIGYERRRRSRSAENVDFEGQDNSRRSSSVSHSSKLKVAKLIDGYLQEIARDGNLPMEKFIALAETVPEFTRPNHDNLYQAVDTYLKAHPDLEKRNRKRLCQIMNCKKLSVDVCMHAAQNEQLPLRVVVQVLCFEQARATMSGAQVKELPNDIKALLARRDALHEIEEDSNPRSLSNFSKLDDNWSISGTNYQKPKLATLRMKLAEDDNDMDDDLMHTHGLERTTSSRFKALCSLPNKPRRLLSKLWSMNRSERH